MVVNGHVWSRPGASAVAVRDDRIVGIGGDREMRDLARRDTPIVDAGGGSIIPAFNDAHVHFLMASRSLAELDLHGVASQDEIARRITDYAGRTQTGWIVGRGWFYAAFPGGMPTVELLDRLVPDRPAYLESFDAHTGWANSRALAIAQVPTRSILIEAAMLDVTRHVPRSRESDLDALRAGMRIAASRGIGSVQEAGEGLDQLPMWQSLSESGELTLRVRLAFDMTPGLSMGDWSKRLDEYERARRDGDPWISTGILKAFADGVVESKTAALLEPYVDSDERGESLWGSDELRLATQAADARGWQVQVHAIGDAAIRQALDAFEGTRPGRRHRVEHIEVPHPHDVPRFGRMGVVASMQPQHSEPKMIEVWRRHLGPERAARGWPWATIQQAGGRLAFGTDWPVVPLDPHASIAAASDIGVEGAVAAWTSGSAYAEHTENVKGQISEGFLADIAIVDFDSATVKATIVGGQTVYPG